MNVADAIKLRRCVLGSIPERLYDEPVDPEFIYVPRSHVAALDPSRALVVGGRGTGKTFWWETLGTSDLGPLLLSQFFDARKEGLHYEVSVGYGAKTVDAGRPLDADTLGSLFDAFPPRVVWKTVVLHRIAPERLEHLGTWRERVGWVHEDPERAARILAETDDELFAEGRRHIVVFDAIDRTAHLWKDVVKAHHGLFGLLLDLLGTRALRAKAFVRLDVLNDPYVLAFPDASKLLTAKVELSWKPTDLYGLLWRYLANSRENADVFRALFKPRVGWKQAAGAWMVPTELTEEAHQEALWHQLAGRWMGTNERRGDTYRWLVNHLADAFGSVSPRSFLAAIRAAALATPDDEPQVFHHRAIQEGVREAAEIRAREIKEDFPWADQALTTLKHLVVPCIASDVLGAWEHAKLEELLEKNPEARRRARSGGDLAGVIEDLRELGVMERLPDNRINVPDVYRLPFGIGRMGGVPARRA
ncbi:MAG TPA: hypothetical protein VGG39_06065 [Polyangiaceae bacterium]